MFEYQNARKNSRAFFILLWLNYKISPIKFPRSLNYLVLQFLLLPQQKSFHFYFQDPEGKHQ